AGRHDELARLDALADAGDRPGAVVISAIAGSAGVGKTTLAVHWAHRVRDRFPDGQLYVNLRGFDPTGAAMSAADPIRRFLGAVDDLVELCARLPLALAIVAASAAIQPRQPLAELAHEIRNAHDRFDALSTGDAPSTDVRAVLSWSYEVLSPGAARLFRLLGLHPGPDITIPAAASPAG